MARITESSLVRSTTAAKSVLNTPSTLTATATMAMENSSVRTAQQTEIGRFWTDNPAAQYSRALRGLIDSQGLDTADAARLGAMFFVAGARAQGTDPRCAAQTA